MHPIAFQFGPFTLHWYGVLVALGCLAGLWNASRRAPRAGLPAEMIVDLGPWLVVGGILGGRLLYVVTHWRKDFASQPWWEIFMIHHGGLVFYGGLIGATFAGTVFVLWKRLPFLKLADVFAPGLALGYGIGRLGCLMNGCCYGRACDLPWAISYPEGHDTHAAGAVATAVHPTQVYESFLNLALYAFLAWYYPRRKFDGQIFALYLLIYAVLRSFVELFRGDYPAHYLGGWATPAHLVSIGIFVTGAGLFWLLLRRHAKSQ